MVAHVDTDPMFLAWLAGFWEGEGSFRVRLRSSGKLKSSDIGIWQSNREILERVREKVGFGTVYLHKRNVQSSDKVKDAWGLMIYGVPRIQYFFSLIMPYLQFRREEVVENLRKLEGRRKGGLKQPLGF